MQKGVNDTPEKTFATVKEVQRRYQCGVATARRLGKEAGAVVPIGTKSQRFLIEKIDEYLTAKAEHQGELQQ